ncbi:MAG: HipA domain-containing protein [Candidatus Caenarcaniphilales bacterium]|nr:HipA domain-containing protein [Candidatus Caenarcaniphilales bacterium]
MKKKRCLICYEELQDSNLDYHPKCSKKFFGRELPPVFPHKLSEIQKLGKQEINKNLAVTGVQKKLFLEIERNDRQSRLTILDKDYSEGYNLGEYILKPPTDEYLEMPETEDLTMHLAHIAGIATVPHCLIKMTSGELAYLTKRIDRQTERGKRIKIHIEDMCQLSERLTEDKYKGSVEQVGKIIKAKCRGIDLINFYELVIFCFVTGNSDMHLKNFSLIHAANGILEMAPAYDLLATQLINPADKEESALTINGKKNKLKLQDFYTLAETLGIAPKARDNAVQRITKSSNAMSEFVDKVFISAKLKKEYKALIQERTQRLA